MPDNAESVAPKESQRLQRLERNLRSSLERDRSHPSRCTAGDDGTVVVRPSGTSCGLACAISLITGEDDDAVMNRVAHNAGSTNG